jgi:hypothetical protein
MVFLSRSHSTRIRARSACLARENGRMQGDVVAAVQARYRRFARDEAPGRSPLYAAWAAGVAADATTAGILARIPETHRQPPLVFAVARLRGSGEGAYAAWAGWVAEHADELVAECAARSIQTNEPGRCAVLLLALAQIDGPIALLEVGASAGLCLHPDRYSYRYATAAGTVALDPADGVSPVVLACALEGDAPLALPEVVWRAGIDLHPLDPADDADRAWLTGLVWPGETGRVARVRAALDVAAADPAPLWRADALDALADVAALAPKDATLVITTPGVLAHVPRAGRGPLIERARSLGRWITLDDPALHDGWRRPLPDPWPGGFALALDGTVLAAVDPLGASAVWLHAAGRVRG